MKPFEICPVCGADLETKQVEKLLRGGGNMVSMKVVAEERTATAVETTKDAKDTKNGKRILRVTKTAGTQPGAATLHFGVCS